MGGSVMPRCATTTLRSPIGGGASGAVAQTSAAPPCAAPPCKVAQGAETGRNSTFPDLTDIPISHLLAEVERRSGGLVKIHLADKVAHVPREAWRRAEKEMGRWARRYPNMTAGTFAQHAIGAWHGYSPTGALHRDAHLPEMPDSISGTDREHIWRIRRLVGVCPSESVLRNWHKRLKLL
jgi:hypothetical protein